jgi:hypothetical protein
MEKEDALEIEVGVIRQQLEKLESEIQRFGPRPPA